MNRLPRGYDTSRHVMSCENEKSVPRTMRPLLSSRLALTWSSDAPTLVASGTKKKSNDMRELSGPGGAGTEGHAVRGSRRVT
jgi:hypothetical protein